MKTTFKMSLFLSLTFVVILSVGQRKAKAYDYYQMYMPASMCVDYNNSHDNYYNYSRLGNNDSSNNLYVDCPIPLESVGTSSDPCSLTAYFSVIDRNSSSNISCSQWYIFWGDDNTKYGSSDSDSTSGSSINVDTLMFEPPTVTAINSYSYISCRIPPKQTYRSWLVQYRNVEQCEE
jgi:hypothetical protein